MNILLIEDNPGDVELTRLAFNKNNINYDMHVASDGMEGIEYLRACVRNNTNYPDIILLDINMPRMSGKEVLELIKADSALCNIPVIMLSSSEAGSDVLDSYQLHANTYLVKPSSMDTFTDVARRINDFWNGLAKIPHKVESKQAQKADESLAAH